MKLEASLQRFLRQLKRKKFFNETEYDKLYPSSSNNLVVIFNFIYSLTTIQYENKKIKKLSQKNHIIITYHKTN